LPTTADLLPSHVTRLIGPFFSRPDSHGERLPFSTFFLHCRYCDIVHIFDVERPSAHRRTIIHPLRLTRHRLNPPVRRFPGKKQILRHLGYVLASAFRQFTRHDQHFLETYIRIALPESQMSRPSAKLCAECFPGSLRPSRALRGVGVARERTYNVVQRSGMSSAATRREQTSPCTSSAGRFVGERLPLRSTQRVRGLATASDATAGVWTPAGWTDEGV